MSVEKEGNIGLFPLPARIEKAYEFAALSIMFAFIIIPLAGFDIFQTHQLFLLPENYSNFLSFFDSAFFQLLAFLYCLACLINWKINGFGKKIFKRRDLILKCFMMFAILLSIIAFSYFLNDYIYKSLLQNDRPNVQRTDLGFINQYLKLIMTETSGGAPSGYATRGIFLVLVSVLCCLGAKNKTGIFNLKVMVPIQISLLILTCIARVTTGYHFLFDILIGLSLGTYTFWLILFMLGISKKIAGFDYKPRKHYLPLINTIFFLIILGYLLIGFFYSKDSLQWIYATLLLSIVIFIIKLKHDMNASFDDKDILSSQRKLN